MAHIDIDEETESFKKSAYFAQEQQNEKKVIARFQPIFTPENLDNLTAEEFKSFLLIKNNKHWDGIHRHGGRLTEDMDRLRDALRVLLDEERTIEDRLDQLFPKDGENFIKGLGRATVTPILLIVYPNKYSVYNRKVEVALKACALYPDERGMSLAQRYVKVNQLLTDLAQRHHISRFLLDWVFHRITVQVEETKVIPPADEDEAEIIPEASLRDLLVAKWADLRLLKDYEIYEEDGEEAVEFSTGEVGRIDILARHPESNDWLVVELKKGQASDAVVGQILRYKGWVRENLVESGEQVRGVIVAAEADDKLHYAVGEAPDVDVLRYRVSVSLDSPGWSNQQDGGR